MDKLNGNFDDDDDDEKFISIVQLPIIMKH